MVNNQYGANIMCIPNPIIAFDMNDLLCKYSLITFGIKCSGPKRFLDIMTKKKKKSVSGIICSVNCELIPLIQYVHTASKPHFHQIILSDIFANSTLKNQVYNILKPRTSTEKSVSRSVSLKICFFCYT